MLDIYEFDSKNNLWKPFLSDDLQVELVMLNPYIRTQLKLLSNNKPTYTLSFIAPDKHGVFKFVIDYKRLGYSYIDVTTKLPLRPFRHNEFPRYLTSAYPYYISVIVMFAAFLVFSVVFLFSKSRDSGKIHQE
jgi:oligosaccharyltransferase complex subunit beta